MMELYARDRWSSAARRTSLAVNHMMMVKTGSSATAQQQGDGEDDGDRGVGEHEEFRPAAGRAPRHESRTRTDPENRPQRAAVDDGT